MVSDRNHCSPLNAPDRTPSHSDSVLTRCIGHSACVSSAWLAMTSVSHRRGSRCPNTSRPSRSVYKCASFRLHLCSTAASEYLFFSPSSHYLGHNAFKSVELCDEFIFGKTGCPIASTIFQHLTSGFTCLLQPSRDWHTLH